VPETQKQTQKVALTIAKKNTKLPSFRRLFRHSLRNLRSCMVTVQEPGIGHVP